VAKVILFGEEKQLLSVTTYLLKENYVKLHNLSNERRNYLLFTLLGTAMKKQQSERQKRKMKCLFQA